MLKYRFFKSYLHNFIDYLKPKIELYRSNIGCMVFNAVMKAWLSLLMVTTLGVMPKNTFSIFDSLYIVLQGLPTNL
jgi:hypothetical protein